MAILHTIRKPSGGTIEVKLTPLTAIVALCEECVCWDRKEVELCSSPLCPVYPFRLGDAHSGKVVSEVNRQKAKIRLAEYQKRHKSLLKPLSDIATKG